MLYRLALILALALLLALSAFVTLIIFEGAQSGNVWGRAETFNSYGSME